MIERARWGGTSGFEFSLVPSGGDPGRFTIESIGEISRRSALKTLRTFGLAPAIPSVLTDRFLAREEQDSTGGVADRIEVVRLSPRQTLRLFGTIRRRDPSVSELYADLEGRRFSVIFDRARGTVMRAYSADGLARGGGTVVELAHERPDGAIASFHVSTRERMGGNGAVPDEVSADYTVRLGERVETRAVGGGTACCGERDARADAVKGRASQSPGT